MRIVLYSSTGCEYCRKIKSDLARMGLPYEERNVTERAEFFDDLHAQGIFSVPVTFVEDRPVIGYRPNAMKKLLAEVGWTGPQAADPARLRESAAEEAAAEEPISALTPALLEPVYDFLVIGAGPAGSSAAVYAARAGLRTLVVDKAPTAGALALTHKIANYPGVPAEVTGLELLTAMRRQARRFGAAFVRANITSVDLAGEIKAIRLPEGEVKARAVFIAVGSRGRAAKVRGEERFEGRGVSYCATCDAAFFKGKRVAVVGDNAEAADDAVRLARFASEVRIYLPGRAWTADAEPPGELSNVSMFYRHPLLEVFGEDALEGIAVGSPDGETRVPVDGVFIYLAGNRPGTEFLGGAVERDADGYVIVDEFLRTGVAGVFAGGDARRTPVKQAVVAAADGAVAAMAADMHIHGRRRIAAQYS